MAAVLRPRFYPLIAIVLALFTIAGFSRTYYLRFLTDLPPMRTLVHLHGAVFTAWLALFIVQTRFIAANRVDLHRKLGIAGVVLAILIVALGVETVAVNAGIPRIRPTGLTAPQFTVVGLTAIGSFAIFVALGIAFRKRAALHKRFMVLAMIAVLTAPASRLLTLIGLRDYQPILEPVFLAGFVLWCLVHDWRQHRIVHPVFAIGGALIVVSWPLRLVAGRSEWYQPVAEWMVRLGAAL